MALSIKTLPAVPPQTRIIFVGDVHGCLEEFNRLLQECRYNHNNDVLILVGDLVNKGYDSIGVIRRVMQLKAYCVLGNHDAALIARCDHIREGDIDPMSAEYRDDPMTQTAISLPKDCYDFLTMLPHVIKIPQFDVVVVHAGLNPRESLDKQNLWDLLHMRRVLPNGRVTDAQNAGELWATKWKGPQTIIFGHDARTGFQQHSHAIGLDTGCCYGGDLTAYILPTKTFVKVPGSKRGVTKKPYGASPATAIGFSPTVEPVAAMRKSPGATAASLTQASNAAAMLQMSNSNGSYGGTQRGASSGGSPAMSLTDQVKSMLSIGGRQPSPAATAMAESAANLPPGRSLLFPSAPAGGPSSSSAAGGFTSAEMSRQSSTVAIPAPRSKAHAGDVSPPPSSSVAPPPPSAKPAASQPGPSARPTPAGFASAASQNRPEEAKPQQQPQAQQQPAPSAVAAAASSSAAANVKNGNTKAAASATTVAPTTTAPAPSGAPARSPPAKPADAAYGGRLPPLLTHTVSTAADMFEHAAASGTPVVGSYALKLVCGDAVDDWREEILESAVVPTAVWAKLMNGLAQYTSAAAASESEITEALGWIQDIAHLRPDVGPLVDSTKIGEWIEASKAAAREKRSARLALRGLGQKK